MGFDEAGCGWVIVALGSQPPGQRSAGRAADAVLVRDGPGVVTVRPVAAQAGIAPMGVYNRLGGKDGLVDALLIRGFAAAAFGELVRNVEMAAAAGGIAAPDSREVAQQIWSSVHGAVALEMKGLVLTPDPEATYRATVHTLLRGLAP
jgi:AcrR family transcriptional regulator